jgi:hypothetical protein
MLSFSLSPSGGNASLQAAYNSPQQQNGLSQQGQALQSAYNQFQGGAYNPQPNNFAFQQQPQMPQGGMQAMQSAHQQMQAARAQTPYAVSSAQAPAQAASAPAGLQQAFNQFQSGTYQAQPNNFAFQQQSQMPQGAIQQMQAAHQQLQASGGIGSAIADMQAMYGRNDNNIGEAIASMSAPQNLQSAYNSFQSGTYQPQPNNFAFQQQPQMPQGGMQAMQSAINQRGPAVQAPRQIGSPSPTFPAQPSGRSGGGALALFRERQQQRRQQRRQQRQQRRQLRTNRLDN